ncbi:ABC transporter ATP-binding protein [Candidatus Bathyarchaeota archaeon]|nr:ABC transporter ATP-binding protein [Candidatus Bathyarchaeota archaeon]
MEITLDVKEISKKFGGLKAVNDFSMNIEKGIIHGLIGPNGAGKTTVFNMIMGEIRPDKGQIFYNGENITHHPTYKRVMLGISRTYQILREFPQFTVLENIAFPMLPKSRIVGEEIIWSEAKNLAIEFSLEEHLSRYPTELSIGSLRKVELCRALITKPKLILCDELYSGLTHGEIKELNEKIMKLNKEREITFLVIDHNLKALKDIVNKVTVINFGSKIAEGTFEEVINNPTVQKAYLGEER